MHIIPTKQIGNTFYTQLLSNNEDVMNKIL